MLSPCSSVISFFRYSYCEYFQGCLDLVACGYVSLHRPDSLLVVFSFLKDGLYRDIDRSVSALRLFFLL